MINKKFYFGESRLIFKQSEKKSEQPIISQEGATTLSEAQDPKKIAETIVSTTLAKHQENVKNLTPEIQSTLSSNLKTYIETSAQQFDQNSDLQLSLGEEVRKFTEAMNAQAEAIVIKYGQHADEEKKKVKAQEQQLLDFETEVSHVNPENIEELDFSANQLDSNNLTSSEGLEGEINKFSRRHNEIQDASIVMDTQYTQLIEATQAFEQEKSKGSGLASFGAIALGVTVIGGPMGALAGAGVYVGYRLLKHAFGNSDMQKKVDGLNQKIATLKTKFTGGKGKIEDESKTIAEDGQKLNQAPEKLRETTKQQVDQEKDSIKSNQQVVFEQDASSKENFDKLQEAKKNLQERLAKLTKQREELAARENQAQQGQEKAEFKQQDLATQNNEIDQAIGTLEAALPLMPDSENKTQASAKLEILKQAKLEGSTQFEAAKTSAGGTAKAAETFRQGQSGTDAVQSEIVSQVENVINPSLDAIAISMSEIDQASLGLASTSQSLDLQFEEALGTLNQIDAGIADAVLLTNINNQFILENIGKQVESLTSLKVEGPNLWESTMGALGTSISDTFRSAANFLDEIPAGEWPVLGQIKDLAIGVAKLPCHIGEGIGTIIAHPVIMGKSLLSLVGAYNPKKNTWFDASETGESWSQLGKALIAADEWGKNKWRWGGEAGANVVFTFLTLGGGQALRAAGTAGQVAAKTGNIGRLGRATVMARKFGGEMLKNVTVRPFQGIGRAVKAPYKWVKQARMPEAGQLKALIGENISRAKGIGAKMRTMREKYPNIADARRTKDLTKLKSQGDVLKYMEYEKMVNEMRAIRISNVEMRGRLAQSKPKESGKAAAEAKEGASSAKTEKAATERAETKALQESSVAKEGAQSTTPTQAEAAAIAATEVEKVLDAATKGRIRRFFEGVESKIKIPEVLRKNILAPVVRAKNGTLTIAGRLLSPLTKLTAKTRHEFVKLFRETARKVYREGDGFLLAAMVASNLDIDEHGNEIDEERYDLSQMEALTEIFGLGGINHPKLLNKVSESKEDETREVQRLQDELETIVNEQDFSNDLKEKIFSDTYSPNSPKYMGLFRKENIELLRKYPHRARLELKTLSDGMKRIFRLNKNEEGKLEWDNPKPEKMNEIEINDLISELDRLTLETEILSIPKELLTVGLLGKTIDLANKNEGNAINKLHSIYITEGNTVSFTNPAHLENEAKSKIYYSHLFSAEKLYVKTSDSKAQYELSRTEDGGKFEYKDTDGKIISPQEGDFIYTEKPEDWIVKEEENKEGEAKIAAEKEYGLEQESGDETKTTKPEKMAWAKEILKDYEYGGQIPGSKGGMFEEFCLDKKGKFLSQYEADIKTYISELPPNLAEKAEEEFISAEALERMRKNIPIALKVEELNKFKTKEEVENYIKERIEFCEKSFKDRTLERIEEINRRYVWGEVFCARDDGNLKYYEKFLDGTKIEKRQIGSAGIEFQLEKPGWELKNPKVLIKNPTSYGMFQGDFIDGKKTSKLNKHISILDLFKEINEKLA